MPNRSLTVPGLALVAVLLLAGCASPGEDDAMDGMDHGSPSSPSADANEADSMFALGMVEHHEQAIEMVDVLLEKDGVDERVVDLAEGISAAQGPEIETMNAWLEDWDVDASGMDGMDHGGMMSDDDMQALADASGPEASSLFLEQMIEHHEGAVSMAQDEIDDGRNADAVELARTIVDSQTVEIETMQDLLDSLS